MIPHTIVPWVDKLKSTSWTPAIEKFVHVKSYDFFSVLYAGNTYLSYVTFSHRNVWFTRTEQ